MKQTLRYLWGAALLLLAAAPSEAERLLDIPLAVETEFDENFTVTNLGDEATLWEWNLYSSSYPAYAWCYRYGTTTYDDYLTLKSPVHLVPGMAYRLGFKGCHFERGKEPADLEIMYGTGSQPADLSLLYTQSGLVFKNRYESQQMDDFEHIFEVGTEGDYYLSFHATESVAINHIILEEAGNPSAPAVITDLAAVADPSRELKATISFTVPSKTVTGNDLESVSKIQIMRNGETVATKTGYMPGDEFSWTDQNPLNGLMTYSVTVFAGQLQSLPAEVSVYVGPDAPMPVSALKLVRDGDVSALSWTAPSKGMHDLEITPEEIRYKVERIVNDEPTVLAEAWEGNSYEDTFTSETRVSLAYKVTPFIGTCIGESTDTEKIWIGSVSLPFADSFTDASFGSAWTAESVKGSKNWEPKASTSYPTTTPQDGDGGYAWYNSYNASREDSARLMTPEIIASSATNPMLEFYFMGNNNSYSDYVKLQIQKDGGEWTDVEGATWYPKELKKEGWFKIEVPLLNEIAGCEKFRVGFTAVSAYGYNMAIDNVTIYNLLDNDLAVTGLEAPATVMAGNEASVTVSVRNRGANAVSADDYTLTLTAGEKVFAIEPVGIEAGTSHDFVLTFPVDADMVTDNPVEVSAVIAFANDENNDNNVSETATISYIVIDKPTVTTLSGIKNPENGAISLTWEPAVDTEGYVPTDLTQDFESFDKGYCGDTTDEAKVTMFGDWTAVNNDDSESAYWFYQLPVGFTIFDNTKNTSSYAPKGSSDSPQIIVSSGKMASGNLDQWFISPELTPFDGAVYNVEFKMWPNSSSDSMLEVSYSVSDKSLDSFIPVETFKSSTGSFYPKSVTVPGTAKYIALRNKSVCTGYNQYIALDDIKITSVADVVTGYNVYEIGVGRINNEPVTECEYLVSAVEPTMAREAADNGRKFAVSALYDGGESALGNVISVIPSGIGLTDSEKPFTLEGDRLLVHADAADIYTIDGKVVGRVSAGASAVTLGNGIYVIVVDGKSYKFTVR